MRNGLGGLFWQENERKMKDFKEKMDKLFTILRMKNTWKTSEAEEEKKKHL